MAVVGKGEDANGAVIGLLVGIGLFTAAFAALLDSTLLETSASANADSAVHDSIANRLLDQVVQPGDGWFDGHESVRCVGGRENPAALTPDSVGAMVSGVPQGQFGLGEEDCTGSFDGNHGDWLSYAKIGSLYNAQTSPADNGNLDYEEARRSLDLVENRLGFHIRASPVIDDVAAMLGGPATTPIRAAYIGDFSQDVTEASGERLVAHTSGATDETDHVGVWVDIENDGTTPAAFTVEWSIPLSGATITATGHTPVLEPDGIAEVELRLWKSRDFAWSAAEAASPGVSFTIRDAEGDVGTGRISLEGLTMTAQQRHDQPFVEADDLWFAPGGSGATLTYRCFDGTGIAARMNDWTLEILDDADVVASGPTRLGNQESGASTFTTATTGAYRVRLVDDRETTLWNTDAFNVLDVAPGPYTPVADVTLGPVVVEPDVVPEVELVDAVVGGFDPHPFDPAYEGGGLTSALDGDVYPDFSSVLATDLADKILEDWGTATDLDDVGVLDAYDVIIVGSNVDHSELGSDGFSRAISGWVEAGGTLIVFGSDAQDFGWLDHLSGSGIVTANGGLYAVDENHPVLGVPNHLDYISYEPVSGWSLNERAERFFTHVLREGPASTDGDLLAVSNGGSFGEGRVVLAGYQPSRLTLDQSTTCVFPLTPAIDCQAAKFIENMLTQSYRELMVDYGPPIPERQASGAAQRMVLVDHPDLGDPVVLRLTVYVFPQ